MSEAELQKKVVEYEALIRDLTDALRAQAMPPAPMECKTDAEKIAYAYGWFKALESKRMAQPEQTNTRPYYTIDELNAWADEKEKQAWRNAAIRVGEELSSVGPDGYYDMNAWQWLDWAMEQQPRGKNSLAQPEQEPVGWIDDGGEVFWKDKPPEDGADLYTTPPKPKELEHEPVAWEEGESIYFKEDQGLNDWIRANGTPLYRHPPQRTWVGLTPDEIRGISLASGESLFSAIMFTHDKLKEKNT